MSCLGLLPALLQSQGHISLPTAFCWDRGVHGPRLVIFGVLVIRLNEENNHFSLLVKSMSETGILRQQFRVGFGIQNAMG